MARRSTKRMTYAKAGVDIDLKSECINVLVGNLKDRRKGKWKLLDLPGHFTGLIDFGDLVLTLCTDGVGTKLLVAKELNRWVSIGIDCVAMNVNDTICVGAEPVAFVDYIAVEKPSPEVMAAIGEGLQKGVEQANAVIVGGEVAVMPDLVRGLDLSGTCLGVVEKNRIVTGQKCKPGDAIIGLPSSGIHSNGLTLARKIFKEAGYGYNKFVPSLKKTVGEELLIPTHIYVREILGILKDFDVHGLVNITGGGLRNFIRLREGIGFWIDDPMKPKQIFRLMQELGSVDDKEMYQTFNMGLGFAIITTRKEAPSIVKLLGKGAKIIGKVDDSEKVSVESLGLEYDKY